MIHFFVEEGCLEEKYLINRKSETEIHLGSC